jgi:hypothetical protein
MVITLSISSYLDRLVSSSLKLLDQIALIRIFDFGGYTKSASLFSYGGWINIYVPMHSVHDTTSEEAHRTL